MDIRIYAQGRHFDQTSNLKSLMAILKNYESTYSQCLRIASEKYEIIPAQLAARIKLQNISPGSVDIRLLTDVGTAIAPLAPQIFNYAWLLYKSGYDLIGIVLRHFRSTEEPMTIEINNSPGATVNVALGDQIVTSSDVLSAASAIQKSLKGFAELISNGFANNIKISNPNREELFFDDENKNDYIMPSKEYIEEELVQLECNIIRFNKKSLKGSLEIYDGEEIINKPFIANPEILNDCLDGFKEPMVTIQAYKEVEVNALGETMVIRYHATEINFN
jgi:hypothetical protein